MLSRFHLVPERNEQTDRQTDRQICYINIAHQHTALLTRDKNRLWTLKIWLGMVWSITGGDSRRQATI